MSNFEDAYFGDPSLLEEIRDDAALFGGQAEKSFWCTGALSRALGNTGAVCTLTLECQSNCGGCDSIQAIN